MTAEEAIESLKSDVEVARYIDSDFVDCVEVDAICVAIEALKAESIKHGNWEVAIGYDPKRSFLCSNCRKMAYEPSTYCPACGARMDEEEE